MSKSQYLRRACLPYTERMTRISVRLLLISSNAVFRVFFYGWHRRRTVSDYTTKFSRCSIFLFISCNCYNVDLSPSTQRLYGRRCSSVRRSFAVNFHPTPTPTPFDARLKLKLIIIVQFCSSLWITSITSVAVCFGVALWYFPTSLFNVPCQVRIYYRISRQIARHCSFLRATIRIMHSADCVKLWVYTAVAYPSDAILARV